MHEIRLKALSLANHFTKKIHPYCQLSGEGDGGGGGVTKFWQQNNL